MWRRTRQQAASRLYSLYSIMCSSTPCPAQVLEVEDVVQDEASRRRMRVLAHLPLTATFRLCEVDLAGGGST